MLCGCGIGVHTIRGWRVYVQRPTLRPRPLRSSARRCLGLSPRRTTRSTARPWTNTPTAPRQRVSQRQHQPARPAACHTTPHGTAGQGREGTQHTQWPSKLPLPSFLLRMRTSKSSELATVSTDESIEGEIANPTAVYRTCEENGEVRPGCDH